MIKVSTLAIVLLTIATLTEGVFIFLGISSRQHVQNQLFASEKRVSEISLAQENLNQQLSDLNINKGEIAQKNEDLIKENKNLSVTIIKLEEDAIKFQDEVKALRELNDKVDAENRRLYADNVHLKDKFMCEDQFTRVNFTNNKTVNDKLAEFVEETKNRDEPVSAHYWNLIWSGSKYSIHTVEVHSEKDHVNYVWKFTVYFRGESYGSHENGIFYNDDQCWLYLDK